MAFDDQQFWDSEVQEHMAVAQATFDSLKPSFDELLNQSVKTIENGGKIFFFGNGGSAADSQHLATELTVRYKTDRKPIAAIALTTDSSALTAGGNDMGFDKIFSRQLEALAKEGDLAIGISTSGNSANVIQAFQTAKTLGVATVAFTGETGGKLNDISDIMLKVPSKTTARIQEMHITLGQMLCGALELKLGLVKA